MFAIALWTESSQPPGSGARSHGHQAALHRASRRRSVLRLGAEGILIHPEIERRLSLARPRLLLVPELCSVSLDAGGRDRKAPARTLAGMARRKIRTDSLLEAAVRQSAQRGLSTPPKKNSTRCCSNPSANICSPTCPSASGSAAAWIPPPSCTTPRKPPASRLKTFSISFRGRSFDESELHPPGRRTTTDRARGIGSESRRGSARRHRRVRLLLRRTQRGCRRASGLVSLQDVQAQNRRSRSAAKAPTNCSAAISPIAPTDSRAAPGTCPHPPCALALQAMQPLARLRRQDQLRIQAQALSGRLLDVARTRPRLLEWHLLRRGEASTAEDRSCPTRSTESSASCARNPRQRPIRSRPSSGSIRNIIFPDDILTKVDRMSMAHSRRSAAAVPRSSHRGIRRHAAGVAQNSRVAPEILLKELMKDKLPPAILTRKKDRLRYSRARMAARPASRLADRHARTPAVAEHAGLFHPRSRAIAFAGSHGQARQSRLSPVGLDDSVSCG